MHVLINFATVTELPEIWYSRKLDVESHTAGLAVAHSPGVAYYAQPGTPKLRKRTVR